MGRPLDVVGGSREESGPRATERPKQPDEGVGDSRDVFA
jgi:hypothetical protein